MCEEPNTRTGIRRLLTTLALVEVVAAGLMAIVLAVYVVWLWKLAYWVLGATGVLVVAVFMYVMYRRNFQFSLRTLLLATAVMALFLGLVGKPVFDLWCRHRVFRGVIDAGGEFRYHMVDKSHKPGWAESRFGYDPSAERAYIEVLTDSALVNIAQQAELLPEIEGLGLSRGVTDTGLAQAECVGQLPGLRMVHLMDMPITDAGFESVSKWSQVEAMRINGCSKISDDGLVHLQKMKKLKRLVLDGDCGALSITDVGMSHLERVPRLKSLLIFGVGIGDGGLDHLAKMPQLKGVHLSRTAVTKAGVERLRKTLPNCKVTWDGVTVVPSGTPAKKPGKKR